MEKQMNKIKINCILQGAVAEKFLAIKAKEDLENNTEVIRRCISEFYSLLFKEA
jgi:hypothetical protein